MWKLEQIRERDVPQVNINGKWVPARPENYKYRSLFQRISEAWGVFTGRADAFTWPEGQ